ncbi:hypothetical protein ACHAWF_007803 [Thalassiosira exigua]
MEESEEDRNDGNKNSQNLPEPWQAHVDTMSGQPYYFNPETSVTQWEKPSAVTQDSNEGNGASKETELPAKKTATDDTDATDKPVGCTKGNSKSRSDSDTGSAEVINSSSGVVDSNGVDNQADECFQNTLFYQEDWLYCQPINNHLLMYYTPLEDTVMLGLHATHGVFGWSALGPAGNGGMKGASQIVVHQDDSGTWIAEDRHSFDYVTPLIDDHQDVQLLFAQQDEMTGETAWGVVLPQNSCDESGLDYEIQNRQMFMIWAYHGESHSFNFHTNRGQFTANLLASPRKYVDMSEYDYIDLLMPNVAISPPEKRELEDEDYMNSFFCTYYDLDVLGKSMGFTSDDKTHMVGYRPIFTQGNEKYLHHLILTSCGRPFEFDFIQGGEKFDSSGLYHGKVVESCIDMPLSCNAFKAGWAVGDIERVMPPDVGMPIGEGQRWLLVQSHYYNPSLDEGINDSSGFRLHIARDVRPIDAGMLNLYNAVTPVQHEPLPGGRNNVATETLYVEPECTETWKEPINIISVNHHMHYFGTHLEVVVERGGENLGPIRKEYVFDYNHQGSVEPDTNLKVLRPGDRLAVTCQYDTSSLSPNDVVEFGGESHKEMCFPFLSYYPRQKHDGFTYVTPSTAANYVFGDYTWCSSPPMEGSFGSLCAEMLYKNVPGFFKQIFVAVGYDGPDLSLSIVCNGGPLTAPIREGLSFLLPICPEECSEGQWCLFSENELRAHAQSSCELLCGEFGLSLYPDLGRTELFSTSNILCPTRLFDKPTLAERQACQARGILPQDITLNGVVRVDESGTDDIPV